jgi:hypothetical protein
MIGRLINATSAGEGLARIKPARIRNKIPRTLAEVTMLFKTALFFTPRKLNQERTITVATEKILIPELSNG